MDLDDLRKNRRFAVRRIAVSEEWVQDAKSDALDALKERMWQEVWKENIVLPQAKVEVQKEGEGFVVIASIEL